MNEIKLDYGRMTMNLVSEMIDKNVLEDYFTCPNCEMKTSVISKCDNEWDFISICKCGVGG